MSAPGDLPPEPPEGWDELIAQAREGREPSTGIPAGPTPARAALEPPDDGDPDEEHVARLARMTPLRYERMRVAEAEAMGVRVAVLDREVARARGEAAPGADAGGSAVAWTEIEQWPDPVDGAALLDDLAAVIARHVVLPSGAADAVALWVLHAHAHDTSGISPLLAITSPTPECGKTTLLALLGALVPRPLPASNITTATVFRAVEKWRPTLLVDEADTFVRASDELRGVLNSGHARGSAYVIRTVGDDHEPRRFATWAPKAIALIGKLPATLASRAIHIEMRRMTPGEAVEPVRADRLDHLTPLARQAARWAADYDAALREADPDIPAALSGRRADNWRHMIAIADQAGGDWPARARRAAETLSATDTGQTAGIMLLEDIRHIFAERGEDRLASAALVDALGEMEDRLWPEWKQGRPITPRQVARLLEPFGIAPSTIRFGTGTAKGYRLDDFTDAFARYLVDDPSHPHNPQETAKNPPPRSVTRASDVTDESEPKPRESAACDGVTDREPILWEATL